MWLVHSGFWSHLADSVAVLRRFDVPGDPTKSQGGQRRSMKDSLRLQKSSLGVISSCIKSLVKHGKTSLHSQWLVPRKSHLEL